MVEFVVAAHSGNQLFMVPNSFNLIQPITAVP